MFLIVLSRLSRRRWCDEMIVPNSFDDPNRKVVWNRLCKMHDEIFVYRPSVDPYYSKMGIIEMKKCKDGCWD